LYFAPLKFGEPHPNSLRDAWGRIDCAIQLYVFGRGDSLAADQIQMYKLVGDESEVAPNSTLSDWHRKGLQQLLEAVQARENFLKDAHAASPAGAAKPSGRGDRKTVRRVAWIVVLLLFALLGFKAWRIYSLARVVWDDASQMRGLGLSEPNVDAVRQAGPRIAALRTDFHALRLEAGPFLWFGRLLAWVPNVGGDLAASRDLVIMGDSMLSAADITYQAVSPLLDSLTRPDGQGGFDSQALLQALNDAQPKLKEAQAAVDAAVAARARIDTDKLSPRARELMANFVDRALPWMQDGILIANEFPRMMGASGEGPKTYLLLAQNEDELRPTGGFITAAGTLLLQNGEISSLTFQDSGSLDDWNKAYPTSPWQLRQYMNSPVLVLRDTNWFVDFPTAALYAESLYAYQNDHSVDGVVAFDQHLLVEILRATGPIQVEGSSELIDADNVVQYMRAQKVPPGGSSNPLSISWDSKAFINKLTSALLHRLLGGDFKLEQLAYVLVQALDEHHVLLQFDNPAITPILVRRGWDGAVRPGSGDYLRVVDFNAGFSKVNAVVDTRLTYEVNLADSPAPTARVSILHTNRSVNMPCVPGPLLQSVLTEAQQPYFESDYPIDRCYWDYLRVYVMQGADLLEANPQTLPGDWMIRGETVPPHVDVLDVNEQPGVSGFGLLKVVPTGESVETVLKFAMPTTIATFDRARNAWVYRLRVQKQPGTLAVPITIRVKLPDGATAQILPPGATVQDGTVSLETNLRLDLDLEFLFTLP
jgi:hypothetical protein